LPALWARAILGLSFVHPQEIRLAWYAEAHTVYTAKPPPTSPIKFATGGWENAWDDTIQSTNATSGDIEYGLSLTMRKIAVWILLQTFCAAGFAGSPPLQELGQPFRPSTNLDISWNAPTNGLPAALWNYHVTPYYLGENHDVLQNEIFPFATLETTVFTSQTNLTIYLYCPITDEIK
jgi:hypothetical protein